MTGTQQKAYHLLVAWLYKHSVYVTEK